MAITELATEPTAFIAGDSVSWRKTLTGFSPVDGWSLQCTFVSADTKFTVDAVQDGDDFVSSITPAVSSALIPGRYSWSARVTDGTDVATVGAGALTVQPDISALPRFDSRSHARKMLDAIEAALERRASKDQLDMIEISIFSRTTKRGDGALLEARRLYQTEVNREEAAGVGRGRTYISFRNA